MARPKREEKQASVREILRRHDCDPLDRLIREGITEIKLTAQQAAMPCVQNLLSNYELVPGEGDIWILRPSLANRIAIWRATADFVHPRLRSTEVKVEEDRNITWCIQTWHIDESGKKVCVKSPLQTAPALKRADEPLELQNGEPERTLHDGERYSTS